MTTPTLVQFPIQVKLSDIPGRLRWLADQYEQDAENNPMPSSVLIIEKHEDDIEMRCFGECPTDLELPGLLHLALAWAVSRLGEFTTKR